MALTEENLREKEFHNKLQSKKKERYENRFYKAISNLNKDYFEYLGKNATGSVILDYGCGIGNSVVEVVKHKPKKIIGIDISEISIEKAKARAQELGIDAEYIVDNCEKTKLNDNSFDIVYGSGILHHLKIEKCLDEINRILKSKGTLVFIEPLATNPIINLYRKLTPNSRSKDEHPLVKEDLKYIKSRFFDTNIKYYGFLTLVFFPFYSNPGKSSFFKILSKVDQILFKSKFFRLFAWSVLITAKKN